MEARLKWPLSDINSVFKPFVEFILPSTIKSHKAPLYKTIHTMCHHALWVVTGNLWYMPDVVQVFFFCGNNKTLTGKASR